MFRQQRHALLGTALEGEAAVTPGSCTHMQGSCRIVKEDEVTLLSVTPRTSPKDKMPRLCTYNAYFAGPATVHRRTLFRLPLSDKCVQTLLRFRLGCHKMPRDVGPGTAVPRSQRLCSVCHAGQPGDDYHLVFECQGLEYIRQNYPGLVGQHASTMIHYMWQADLHGVAMSVTECLGVYYSIDPDGGHASDQP